MKILAIETSCDETSASLCEAKIKTQNVHPAYVRRGKKRKSIDIEILSNIVASQIKLHSKYGGVYPELASREHIKNILPVIEKAISYQPSAKSKIPHSSFRIPHSALNNIDAIAVTNGPGLIGSLLTGVNTAKTLAYVFNKPLIPVNHLEGHIYANFIGVNNFNKHNNSTSLNGTIEHFPTFPLIALVVSGGHTSLIYMKKHLDYKIIGETCDDAAGEAYDKVAAMMSLAYPGGPIIDKLSSQFQQLQQAPMGRLNILNKLFPRPMIQEDNFDFSFSGLKTAVLYYLQKSQRSTKLGSRSRSASGPYSKKLIGQICYAFQEAVTDVLVAKTLRATKKYKVKSILLGGGVAANSRLREKFVNRISHIAYRKNDKLYAINHKLRFFVPKKSFCTDNAAIIGAAAAYKLLLLKNKNQWYNINADSNLKISQ